MNKNPHAVALGSLGGKKTNAKLTKEQLAIKMEKAREGRRIKAKQKHGNNNDL